ncbi:MAG TPA: tetratricopeptide repeat protein [Chthonomonadaceae bacterium]|nr:tetratricopeptide repeat protein [Chthonomonadaceae bacterium]
MILGLAVISAAWWYRQRTLAHRLSPMRRVAAPDNAALQAQMATLQAQAARLQARVTARPGDIPARQALLLTYQQLGQLDRAMEQLEAIVRLQPKNHDAHLALANAYLALKQWPRAEQSYRAMTTRWPKDHAVWQGLAAALFHQRRYQEAAQAAQKAEQLQPANPSNRYVLATALQEYAMLYPDPQFHSAALDRARKEFEKLIQVWPNNGDLYFRLGRICIATRDISAAVTNMEKAHQLLPDRADVSLYLAKSYVSSRNRQGARKVLEEALARHPDSADIADALGQLVQSSGEPDADPKALALFQKAVQLAPRNARFQERLGTAYLRTNNLDQARQAFEEAARLNPNRAFPFQQLAAIYTRMGDPKRATLAARNAERLNFNAQQLNLLEATVNAHPNNVPLRLSLADRFLFLGNRGAARNEYLIVLRMDPQNRRAREGLATLDKPQPGTMTASTKPTPSALPSQEAARSR